MLRLVAINSERIDQGNLPRNPAPLARLTRFLSTARIRYEAALKGAIHPIHNAACNLTQIRVFLSPEQARQLLFKRSANPLAEAYQNMLKERSSSILFAEEMRLLPMIVERFAGQLPELPPVEEFIYAAFSPPPQVALSFFFDPQGGLKYVKCDFAGRIYLETMNIRNREYTVLEQDEGRIFFSFHHAVGRGPAFGLVQKDPLENRLINISASELDRANPRIGITLTPIDQEAARDGRNRFIHTQITYLSREQILDFKLPVLEVYSQGEGAPREVLYEALEERAAPDCDLLALFWAKKIMLEIEDLAG